MEETPVIRVERIELSEADKERLTLRSAAGLPAWLDEMEEAGWTKEVYPDGAIEYSRPCNGSQERWLHRTDGSRSYAISPVIMAQMPELKPKRRRWWQFWK